MKEWNAALGITGLAFLLLIIVVGAICRTISTDEATAEVEWSKEGYKTIRMRVTAYCPCVACCGRWSDGIAANGHRMRKGDKLVAAPEKYAFGTRMIIKGYNNGNPVLVKDRGGAIKNGNLDVFFSFHEEAIQWGVQYIEVKIMERPVE